ncbi:hypothetical protein CPLU01_13625 [Colletotrichum plurivorum]|uniref:Uncharacterized protein n=1 Tax=Colletotrichum plurivorum TaxID=2175906 RepID=A0A8H6JRA6_9PEZI|nr:hypothetical protein CPLU01_13625 [Colletotrichum plurivorum]
MRHSESSEGEGAKPQAGLDDVLERMRTAHQGPRSRSKLERAKVLPTTWSARGRDPPMARSSGGSERAQALQPSPDPEERRPTKPRLGPEGSLFGYPIGTNLPGAGNSPPYVDSPVIPPNEDDFTWEPRHPKDGTTPADADE